MDDNMFYNDVLLGAEAGTGVGTAGMSEVAGWQEILGSDNPLATLKKALAAGYETAPDQMTGGNALRIQSLEPTMKNLLFNEKSTTICNDMLASAKTAESTVEEYSTIDNFGEAFSYVEGGLPAQEDDDYSRKYALVKYVGNVCQVSNVITRVRSLQNPIQRETKSKLLAIKRKVDKLMYFGNSTLVSTEWDGLLQWIYNAGLEDTNILDLGGYAPQIEDFNHGVNIIENVAGQTENLRLYISPNARRGFKDQLLRDKIYFVNGNQMTDVALGIGQNKIVYDNGEFPYRKDMFLNPETYPRQNLAGTFISTGDTPPAVPAAIGAGVVGATGHVGSGLSAATYDYAICAINKLGHISTPLTVSSVVVGASSGALITVQDGGSSPAATTTTGFKIYRRVHSTNSQDFRYVGTISLAQAAAGYTDINQIMPDTGYMFLIEWDLDQVLAFHKLMDIAKFPLANVVDSVRWLQRLYGALIVYNPKRIVAYKNVGTTTQESLWSQE